MTQLTELTTSVKEFFEHCLHLRIVLHCCVWLLVLYMRISDIRAFRNMGLKYDLDLLREIGQGAKLKANYHMLSLKYELRMKIIDLDIRKKVRLYKRSRAGKRLHHKIATITMKLRLYRPRNRTLV